MCWCVSVGYWPLEYDVCSQIVANDLEESAVSIFRPCAVSEVHLMGTVSWQLVGTPPKTCVSNIPEVECVLCVSADAVCIFLVLECSTRLVILKKFVETFTAL